jgi:ATP-binding cassette subfamily B (MDR/TAP) protein 1
VFAVTIGALILGMAAPPLAAFAKGRTAAAQIFKIVDRIPLISAESKSGISADRLIGEITFDNVHFAYPSRLEVPILRGMSIHMEKDKKCVLVGESGSGKSTIMHLIERFMTLLQVAC